MFNTNKKSVYLDVYHVYGNTHKRHRCTDKDFDVYNAVQDYQQELTAFFSSPDEGASLKHADENHFLALLLEKKRLSALGIRKIYKAWRTLSFRKNSAASIEYETMNGSNFGRFTETVQKEIVYFRKGSSTLSELKQEANESYHIRLEPRQDEPAVVKVLQHSEPVFSVKTHPLTPKIKFWRLLWFIISIPVILNLILLFTQHYLLFILLGLPLTLAAAIIYINLCIKEFRFRRDGQKPNPYSVIAPEVSEEEFLAVTGNVLTALHYASSTEDVARFVRCNIDPFIAKCQNIFDCELGKYLFLSCTAEESRQKVTYQRSATFYRYINNEAAADTHLVEVTFEKTGDQDWIITDIQMIPFQDEKEEKKWF